MLGALVQLCVIGDDLQLYIPMSVCRHASATGSLARVAAAGRPADVLVLMDGSLLISDDQVGAVYRVAYSPSTTLPTAVAGRRMLSS